MLEDTYGHTPIRKMFDQADCYGIRFDEERAARKPVRLGAIGAGGIAVCKYFPSIKRLKTVWEPVDLVAFVHLEERYGRNIEQTWGGRWYADHQAMLDQEELDGVLVLSSSDVHAEHAIACIEKGLPALVEKPFSMSLVDGDRVCRLAEERNVPLMAVANKRFSPPYRRAKQYVEEGPVDNPAMFCGKFNLGYDYAVQMLEGGTVHVFDLSQFFMGDTARLHATGVNKYQRYPDRYTFDNAVITLEYASGSVGQVCTTPSALSLKPWERVEIYGKNAWLAVEDQYELLLYDSEEGPAKSWKPVIPNTLIYDEEFGGYMGLVENFLEVIRGKEAPFVTGREGYKAYELTVATHLSLDRKGPVDLPLDPAEGDAERNKVIDYNA